MRILTEIRDMPLLGFVLLCVFPAGIMVLLLRTGIKWRHVARVIARTKVIPIGSATEGIAAVEGTAEAGPGGPLEAKLTGASCVWYRTLVERLESSGSGVSWGKRRGDEARRPFLLRDSSGVCQVRALGEYATPTDRSVWFGNTVEPRNRQPEIYPGTMPISEIHAKLSGTEKNFRYTEERIYPGDRVYVLGQFFKTPEDDDDEAVEHHEVDYVGDESGDDEPDEGDADHSAHASDPQHTHRKRGFDHEEENSVSRTTPTVPPLRITAPGDKRFPLVVSGVGAAGARSLHAMRSKGMFILASIFAAVLIFLSWAHFSH